MDTNRSRILVVEDEGVVAKDLQTRLRKLGYDVPMTVQTGEEAVEAAQVLRPELILMDIRLKGEIDGVEASAQIMKRSRTPVIFLTAYADESTLGRAKLTEPFGYILKPFNERELHTAIQVALHKHKTEEALRKSERWLAATLRSVGDALIAVDSAKNVLFMNPPAQRLTGWSGEEAAGKPLSEIFCVTDDAVLFSRDGSSAVIEDQSSSVLDEDGEITGGVVTFRDITARKRAENARRESEEQLRNLANSIPQLVWMAEPDGHIFWYNDRWYEYTNTQPEEMLGWGWQSVHDPTLLPRVMERWREALATGTQFEMEFPLRGAGGGFRWFLTRIIPVRNEEGKIIRWFGTNTDIHDLRETSEHLRRANSNLEQFAWSASHDLQEPLRNISISGQILSARYSSGIDEEGRKFLDTITQGASKAENLVRDLLIYAQSAQPSDTPISFVEAVAELDEVLAGMKSLVSESGARITHTALPRLRIRSMHLRQLFQNLLSNAIKYRNDASPRIHVSARAADGEWMFSVKDNGIGIDPQYRESIFGLFKRLHEAGRYPGTGLGLALCRNIVGLYGGRIWVESEPGRGATFSFTLPRS